MNHKPSFLYQLFNRSLYWFCGKGWFQSLFLSKKRDAIKLFFHSHHIAINEKDFVQQFLFNNSGDLRDWILYSNPPDKIMGHIFLEGQMDLQELMRKNQGIILLNFHTGLSQALHLSLKTMGITQFKHPVSRKPVDPTDPPSDNQNDFTMQLLQAAETLLNGGVVLMAGDGKKGEGRSVMVPFLGRWQEVKTGFAELVVATNAIVVPVSSSLAPNGDIRIKFHSPLKNSPTQGSKEAQIRGLVNDFEKFMAQQWLDSPTTIKYNRLIFHLKQPSIEGHMPEKFGSNQIDPKPHSRVALLHVPLIKLRQLKKSYIQRKTH